MKKRHFSIVAMAIMCAVPAVAQATNGMNLEGYGAKAHALGGTGMAYDTGNSAVMINPATLAFMDEGVQRVGIGLRGLHPHVSSEYAGRITTSGGDSYYMPSISYMRRDGKISWGVALLAQGGMGTEYGESSPLFSMGLPASAYGAGGEVSAEDYVMLSGEDIRSEVSMGRVMFPAAYDISERTSLGWSLDLVWASMDVLMDVDGYTFAGFTQGVGGTVNGSMAPLLAGMGDVNYARFAFSNDNEFTGEADGYGWGVKAGIMHKLTDQVTIGVSYHSQTHITDLETSRASVAFAVPDGDGGPTVRTLNGTVTVKDFEWPETMAAGIAIAPDDRWLFALDLKLLNWSAVMKDFTMEFTASDDASNGMFAGQDVTVSMDQEWDDQLVIALGAQYRASNLLSLRAGANFGSNPVPETFLNPLFPAVVTTHYSCGFGCRLGEGHTIGGAIVFAPDVTETSAQGVRIEHGQTNWSFNYSYTL
ncbi:outer membrane protein transport protein [Prosthecochloris sp. N3]|uniref:Outer membrane protein transport protein n=1 Tax=Prosthecochloris ethylica TaxID=2743976 RepID=A0ABR9XS03_9CHLB|nr:outer membrane protein transport protein [Prosthecochloris ethylica]MBF0585977.1 outer membrane protein transport protein [Prosthecochloris ethylica]MBF0636623.1 outer membrane protein transport protein [Prosthecochloris ethylica]NUK47255.1 outer membrane protein transport protein [Prosthecochloris ethylica]